MASAAGLLYSPDDTRLSETCLRTLCLADTGNTNAILDDAAAAATRYHSSRQACPQRIPKALTRDDDFDEAWR
jgi:hypothetical protein